MKFLKFLLIAIMLICSLISPSIFAQGPSTYIADYSQEVNLDASTLPTQVEIGATGHIRRVTADPYYDLEYSLAFTIADPSILSINEKGEWKALKSGTTTVTVVPAQVNQKASLLDELTQKGWNYYPGVYLGNTPATTTQLQQLKQATFTVTVLEVKSVPPVLRIIPMYRLYNPNNHEHFYTASQQEKDYLVKIGWGKYEGIAWQTTEVGAPVYRLYNPILRDHHYTLDKNEVQILTTKHNWKLEGVAWYSFGAKKVYRLFHPGLTSGSHHYTLDVNEVAVLQSRGWRYEGIAWNAY